MVLSLLVYSVARFKMRNALEERDETVPDQKRLKSLNQSVVTDLKVSPDFIRDLLMAVPTFSHTKKFLENPIIFLSVYAVYNNDVPVCRCYLET